MPVPGISPASVLTLVSTCNNALDRASTNKKATAWVAFSRNKFELASAAKHASRLQPARLRNLAARQLLAVLETRLEHLDHAALGGDLEALRRHVGDLA